MFKSKVRQRRIFSNRRRVRRRFSWLGAIASIVLTLLALELLTRIAVDLAGDRDRFTQAEAEPDITQAYQLNLTNQRELAEDKGSLLATSSLSVGYELIANQSSPYWQINEQGFRDREPVSATKPQGEIRVFLLGNSTAFGYGNSSNSATISAQLQQRLQQRLQQQISSPQLYQPDILPSDKDKRVKALAKPARIKSGNYRVINAAVPGYASGNELAQLALQVLKYQPDLIVVMDGYVDLMLDSTAEAVTVPPQPEVAENSNSLESVWEAIAPVASNSYLIQMVRSRFDSQDDELAEFLLEERAFNLVQYLPNDEEELQNRVDRYLGHQKQMLALSAAAQVPLVVAIQPEITGRDPSQLTDTEGAIATELGRTYIERVRESYPALIQASQKLAQAYPKNLKVVDMYQLTDKYPSPSFIDAIHLNEAANNKVAEQLYYAIASMPKMQLVPKMPPKPVTKAETTKN